MPRCRVCLILNGTGSSTKNYKIQFCKFNLSLLHVISLFWDILFLFLFLPLKQNLLFGVTKNLWNTSSCLGNLLQHFFVRFLPCVFFFKSTITRGSRAWIQIGKKFGGPSEFVLAIQEYFHLQLSLLFGHPNIFGASVPHFVLPFDTWHAILHPGKCFLPPAEIAGIS